uniref:Rab-GAP TBC domain-containing protein n=1 Tax=Anopheles christyi TaxID=43041 RepID=A0A182JXR6_9DIPT
MKAIEAKIVVLGSQGVGKTSLVVRYVSNVYTKEISPTIGASFFTCKVNLEDFKVKMQVWDTAGQERFKAMAPLYYRNANAALLVFDLTQYNSFNEIKGWVQELQRNVQEPMVLSLVGNKLDLEAKRAVSREEAMLYANSIRWQLLRNIRLTRSGPFCTRFVCQEIIFKAIVLFLLLQGIEQVFISIAVGLIKLSGEDVCSSLKRYESNDSLVLSGYSTRVNGVVQMGIPVENDSILSDGMGRLETPSWSRDHIAHGDEQRVGWLSKVIDEMEVNAGILGKREGKASFKFNSSKDGVLVRFHHTVKNETEGTVLRIRFTAAGFSANNERLIAADHRYKLKDEKERIFRSRYLLIDEMLFSRDNVFVFDLVGQRFWTFAEQLKRITVIEGLTGGNLVALGNKEGMVFVVDLDEQNCLRKLNAHPGRIVQLTSSLPIATVKSRSLPKASGSPPVDAFERYDRRYLLAVSQDSAKLYSLDDFSELACIRYGLASNISFRPNGWHWFPAPTVATLISYSTDGIVRVYRANFKLVKEINVTRLIELYLKNTPPQTITFDRHRPVARDGDAEASESVEHTIKRLTEAMAPGSRITTAQPTKDGQYYIVLYGCSTLAFLALDSWFICRVVSLSNLFIAQFAFVPLGAGESSAGGRVRWAKAARSCSLTVRTADNDLMLLNFGTGIDTNPPFLRPLASSGAVHNCYKFTLAPNGRMLANVLTSGEVLLHNLESYRWMENENDPALVTGRHPRKALLKSSRTIYAGKSERPGSSTSSSAGSTGTVYGSCGQRSPRKTKLEQQTNALQVQLSKTLPKHRLLPILKEYGEYPAKYRTTIWRTLQEQPGDRESYEVLLSRGHHPCVASYEQRFAGYDQRTVRNLKRTISCLAHWCPVFGLIDYLPSFILPFARQHPNDGLGLFETVATVLTNQCQLWFEFAPLEPFNYLAMVENVLADCEPRLMAFYRKHNIASRTYAVPLMETAFVRCCCTDDQWLALWDHVLSNEPCFTVFLIAAYSSLNRGTLMMAATNGSNGPATVERFFFHQAASLDVGRLVRRAHDLMERCSRTAHPRNYFKSFTPLSATEPGGLMLLHRVNRNETERWKPSSFGNVANNNSSKNAIDCTSPAGSEVFSARSSSPSGSGCVLPNASEKGSTRTYVSFANFPKKLTQLRCTETDALRAEQRRLEAKIIELEKLEHGLQERMVNNLVRQEHEQRVKEVERNLEEAIAREEQRVEMQRKLLLLHRKQLRERESELSLDVHNAKLISDATIRERELDVLLKKFARERQREETDLLFAEEDIKLKELELLGRYRGEPANGGFTSDERPLDQRYQVALEQLAVQKLKLYDEIDRTYSSLGMPSGVNDYTYRTVSELRKVASVAGSERQPGGTERSRDCQPILMDSNATSQVVRMFQKV